MTTEPFVRAWGALPMPYRVAAVGALAVLILVIVAGVGGAVDRWHQSRFDAAEAKRESERATLTTERDAALDRAKAAEAKAAVLEEQAAALKAVAEQAGVSAAQKAAKAEEIERATQQAVAAVADLPPDQARADIRERLRRLGY